MKKTKYIAAILFLGIGLNLLGSEVQAQTQRDTTKTYLIIKNDGASYTGKIVSEDSREITLLTTTLGEIVIPKHEIKEIRELQDNEVNQDGSLRRSEAFATRYFLSTNGLGLEKGESYIIWSLFGPDAQFGVSDNVSLGVLTTWFGTPIVGTAKYSHQLSEKTHLGLGTLLGTGSWAALDVGFLLPFASITAGDATKNISFSVGYGLAYGEGESAGSALFSVGGVSKMNDKLSFVFDSYIMTDIEGESGALIIPGLRFQTEENKAFQIGFAGVVYDGELAPFPFPMLQWFRKL